MKLNISSTQNGRLSISEEHETMCHAFFQTTSKLSRVYFFFGLGITDLCFAFDSTLFQALRVRNADIFYRSLKIYRVSTCHDSLYIRDMKTVIHCLGELTGKKNYVKKN